MRNHRLPLLIAVFLSLAFNTSAATLYVDLNCTTPTPPYTNWTTAATNIQDAVDAANAGDHILVTNGVYQTGGRTMALSTTTNRVAVTKPVTVESVNGPLATTIQGYQVPGTITGGSAVRCAFLTNGAALIGFTLSHGATMSWEEAGGIVCFSNAVVENCTIISNSADADGGGANGGTLNNCQLIGNSSIGSTVSVGGGASLSTLNNCTLMWNSATGDVFGSGSIAGGAYACKLNSCLVVSNSCTYQGGGTYSSTLNNCTLVRNSAGNTGGGDYGSRLNNCIVYYNSAPSDSNAASVAVYSSCTTPLPSGGSGNITNEPVFVNLPDGNFHLRPGSPCINAGNNDYVTTDADLDGRPRIGGAAVDMGAYETQTRFVDLNSASPVPPYVDWSTAATNIQDGIDAAVDGDLVLVNDGIYATGGRVHGSALTNRVVVDKTITLQSAHGPELTVIQGYQVPGTVYGPNAVRCVWLLDTAALIGFTLTNGATQKLDQDDSDGGGVRGKHYVDYTGVVSNCIITGNSADHGGGASWVTLKNCILRGNYASGGGGGADNSTLVNCAILNNTASIYGGGVYFCIMTNCLLVGNAAADGGGSYSSFGFPPTAGTMYNCTVISNTSWAYTPGVSGAKMKNCIVYYNYDDLGSEENCVDSTITNCCTRPTPLTGSQNTTNPPVFVDLAGGDYHLTSNSPCVDAGDNRGVTYNTDLDGNPRIVGTVDIGAYEFPIHYPDHYVSLTSTNPMWPYIDWSIAATNIQDAISASTPGDRVIVSNGVYQVGGRAIYGTLANRVAVTKPITLQSLNGPDGTFIKGYQVPGTTNGEGAVRCVYLTNGAVLTGFTLTNGATRSAGDAVKEQSGGGVWSESASAVVSNCVLTGNSAVNGGGAFGGTLYRCILSNNRAYDATYGGGGAASNTLYRCSLFGNAAKVGGGVLGCLVDNCLLASNAAWTTGGGAFASTLNDCTVVANVAPFNGGGVSHGYLTNTIVYYNISSSGSSNIGLVAWFNWCCTVPIPTSGPLYGAGNFTNEPRFVNLVGGDYRLQPNSPCINAGNNSYVTNSTDIDGNPRISGGTVDIGAYEFQNPASLISYAWLQQYGLPTDGSADYIDTDNDLMNTWQEWRAGTTPTNALSLLKMLTLSNDVAGTTVTWQSVGGVSYSVERSDLTGGAGFSTIQTNVPGQTGSTSFTDTNAVGAPRLYYRVGVQ